MFFVFAALLFGAGQAQARRGIMIISTGSTHSEMAAVKKDAVAKVPAEIRADIERRHLDTVGYQYSHFGIFWLDLWNWGGEYIIYNKVSEDGGVTTPEVAATLMGANGKPDKPLNYRMPFGLCIIVGLGLLKFLPRFILARKQSRAAAPQYQQTGTPRWTPPSQPAPPYEPPHTPPSGGPPPMPPPLPPEQP